MFIKFVTNNNPVADMQTGLKIAFNSFYQRQCKIFHDKAHVFLNINELLQIAYISLFFCIMEYSRMFWDASSN
jgi:hypothetical protein